MMDALLSLIPQGHEDDGGGPQAVLLSLEDALAVRDAAVTAREQCQLALEKAEALQDQAKADRDALAVKQNQQQRANILTRTARKMSGHPEVDPVEVQRLEKAYAAAILATQSAREAYVKASIDVEGPHAAVMASAQQHYEDLLKDKRRGAHPADGIPCSEWRADVPDGEHRCHCLEVPGNTWPEGSEPPHNADNRLGQPWCPAHQDWTCGGPHPVVRLEQFLARFALPAHD